MLTEAVSGFMVVRVPQANFYAEGRDDCSVVVHGVEGVYYGGYDRMPWFDVDHADIRGELSNELQAIRKGMATEDFTGLDLTLGLNDALRLLEVANRKACCNEIIALASDMLTSIKGTTKIAAECIEWIGYDVGSLGHSSLLLEGMFAVPDLFNEVKCLLNDNGLIWDEQSVERYVDVWRFTVLCG